MRELVRCGADLGRDGVEHGGKLVNSSAGIQRGIRELRRQKI
jgi:hypothetical protein